MSLRLVSRRVLRDPDGDWHARRWWTVSPAMVATCRRPVVCCAGRKDADKGRLPSNASNARRWHTCTMVAVVLDA